MYTNLKIDAQLLSSYRCAQYLSEWLIDKNWNVAVAAAAYALIPDMMISQHVLCD